MSTQNSDRVILEITGADRLKFLQGLVTNDVNKASQGIVYTAFLTPQGKYLFDFFMLSRGDAILLDVPASQADGLQQRLSMYRLRADVAIGRSDLHVVRGLGDVPSGAFSDPRHPDLGWRAYRAGAGEPSPHDWDAIRVAHCVPKSGVELIANDTYILEAGFEALNGVDFKKGCYVGQEITARMKHKTELKKGLALVNVVGETETGSDILADGKIAGTLFTRAGDTAIAYLRFGRAKGDMTCGTAKITLK